MDFECRWVDAAIWLGKTAQLRTAEPPDDEPDEAPERITGDTDRQTDSPQRVEDPPPQPDSKGPYVVAITCLKRRRTERGYKRT